MKDKFLLICVTDLINPFSLFPLRLLIDSNKDIFVGLGNDKKNIVNIWIVFKSDDCERLNALAFMFRKMLDKIKIKSKYMIRIKKSLPKNFIIINKMGGQK